MDIEKPEWFDKWVDAAPGRWQLREEAPPEVVKAFKVLMRQLDDIHRVPSDDPGADIND